MWVIENQDSGVSHAVGDHIANAGKMIFETPPSGENKLIAWFTGRGVNGNRDYRGAMGERLPKLTQQIKNYNG